MIRAGANTFRHLHRGPPARVGSVALRVETTRPCVVVGEGLVLLHANSNEPDGAWPDRKALVIVESWWTPDGEDPRKLTGPLSGAGALTFTFADEELYQVWDRWAVDVSLAIDGIGQVVQVPLRVLRVEPR